MSDGVRVWAVKGDDSLAELQPAKLDYEERIETWICDKVSVLVPDDSGLLVIGRQVETSFGGRIDLLCMDREGDLVVVELKRDKTPREITAQALDYASWVRDLTFQEVEEIAASYLKGKPLKDAFEEAFVDSDFPESINGQHSIMIVASRIDDSTERIIRYLSDQGIAINFVRFHLFRSPEGVEHLVRTFVVPPEQAEENSRKSPGNKKTSQRKTLQDRAEQTENEAERAFLNERMSDPKQESNKSKRALFYKTFGKLRFMVRARTSWVNVIQRGRFTGDEAYWKEHLSIQKIGFRRSAKDLSFTLHTKEDFKFFQETMEKKLAGFHWTTMDPEPDEEEDDENET